MELFPDFKLSYRLSAKASGFSETVNVYYKSNMPLTFCAIGCVSVLENSKFAFWWFKRTTLPAIFEFSQFWTPTFFHRHLVEEDFVKQVMFLF